MQVNELPEPRTSRSRRIQRAEFQQLPILQVVLWTTGCTLCFLAESSGLSARPAGIVRPLPLTVLQRASRVERCRMTAGMRAANSATTARMTATAPNVRGSSALMLTSWLASARAARAAPIPPRSDARRDRNRGLAHDQPHHAHARSPQRETDADLAVRCVVEISDDAVNAHGGEQQADAAEKREQDRVEVCRLQRLRHPLLHRPNAEERHARIDSCDGASDGGVRAAGSASVRATTNSVRPVQPHAVSSSCASGW